MGLSKMAYHLGGVLHNADALAAIFNPTVNSYKRIDAQVTLSGATWSPNAITYGGNNRTHGACDEGRRSCGHGWCCEPYLLQAGVLAAGLDGVATSAIQANRSISTCIPKDIR